MEIKLLTIKKIILSLFCIASLFLYHSTVVQAVTGTTYYIDSANGNDSSNGTSTDTPWKTVAKVNSSTFSPGDKILFKRGEIWKGSTSTLIPTSGDSSDDITYGAYGNGAKPVLTSAKDFGDPSKWIDEGSNVWSTLGSTVNPIGSELLPNPSADTNTANWIIWFNQNSSGNFTRTTTEGEFDSAPAGFKLSVINNGDNSGDIQLWTRPLSIIAGKTYKFTLRAMTSNSFGPITVSLFKNTSPFTDFADTQPTIQSLSTSWKTYTLYYQANTTANDARINFNLGNIIPDGANLFIDSLSFKEAPSDEALITDVGNIIMQNKSVFGVKTWDRESLNAQGEFFYDIDNYALKMYSTQNPALFYNNDITLVMRNKIIDVNSKSYLTFENLDISMGAELGISMYNSDHITIKNCDFSYIGGGDQYMDKIKKIRFGNAIQLWNDGHDISVYNNKLWQIYDAALTPQGFNTSNVYNLYFYNNLIWDSEYGIEFWEKPATGAANNVYFDNNTIVDSGNGWSHNQRPDPNGRAFLSYNSTSALSNIFARNNIFLNSTESNIRIDNPSWISNNFNLDFNHYDESSVLMQFYLPTVSYNASQFGNWKTDYIKDINSIMAPQSFTNYASKNFSQNYNSPDIDSGTALSYRTTDFLGNPIYGIPDIGAYEYQPPYLVRSQKIDISAGARVYGDGKFRDLGTVSGNKADLAITPQGGFSSYGPSETRPQWLDITFINWSKSSNYHKQWKESSTLPGLTNTVHSVGDLDPGKYYLVKVSGDRYLLKADSLGKISFTYTGTYLTPVIFDVSEHIDTTTPTVPPNSDPNPQQEEVLNTNLIFFAKSKVIKKGGLTKLIGQLRDSKQQPVVNKKVTIKVKVLKKIKKKVKGRVRIVRKFIWRGFITVLTDANGNFSFKVKPKKTTNYKAKYSGDTAYQATNSNNVKVIVK